MKLFVTYFIQYYKAMLASNISNSSRDDRNSSMRNILILFLALWCQLAVVSLKISHFKTGVLFFRADYDTMVSQDDSVKQIITLAEHFLLLLLTCICKLMNKLLEIFRTKHLNSSVLQEVWAINTFLLSNQNIHFENS